MDAATKALNWGKVTATEAYIMATMYGPDDNATKAATIQAQYAVWPEEGVPTHLIHKSIWNYITEFTAKYAPDAKDAGPPSKKVKRRNRRPFRVAECSCLLWVATQCRLF